MGNSRPANRRKEIPNLLQISQEWDRVALSRHKQLTSGKDISFSQILLPIIRDTLKKRDPSRVLDIGCGTGVLAKEIAPISGQVTGVDLSPTSIEIARSHCSEIENVSFYRGSIENFAASWSGSRFTIAVANMSIMDCADIETFLGSAADLLIARGTFLATVTHPWFWPQYRGYHGEPWFRYHEEVPVSERFRISDEQTSHITSHVHRPLATYTQALSRAGLLIDRIFEPFPEEDVERLYPEPWEYPRFLAFLAHRA